VTASVEILLVEDDDDLREVLVAILVDAGYEVTAAANGSEALQWLRAAVVLPRLILLDLMMPVMDGWRFREEQLADAALASIPVATLSAMPTSGLEAVAHFNKPIDLPALLGFIARVLGERPRPARAV
jgi:CheY-like chemotaxis protein